MRRFAKGDVVHRVRVGERVFEVRATDVGARGGVHGVHVFENDEAVTHFYEANDAMTFLRGVAFAVGAEVEHTVFYGEAVT